MQQPRDFSLQGAVDLGARQAAAQRRQRAAETSAGEPDDQPANVLEVTDENFNTEVAARSRTVPVVLDLWAEWCGPCKQLGPVLEKLAAEGNGAWVLGKVDVDANPQLSAALQVQSIPMVVAVLGGQIVDAFLGALPEPQVRQWIGQIVQAAEQLGLAGPAAGDGSGAAADRAGADGLGPGSTAQQAPGQVAPGLVPPGRPGPDEMAADSKLAEAQQAMERGDLDGAAGAFADVLAMMPGDPAATMGLAQVDLVRRVSGYDQARVRQDAAALPDDVDAQAKAADLELALGEVDTAFGRLLDTVKRTSGTERDKARRHLLDLFEIFPPREPRVARARATLSSLLF